MWLGQEVFWWDTVLPLYSWPDGEAEKCKKHQHVRGKGKRNLRRNVTRKVQETSYSLPNAISQQSIRMLPHQTQPPHAPCCTRAVAATANCASRSLLAARFAATLCCFSCELELRGMRYSLLEEGDCARARDRER